MSRQFGLGVGSWPRRYAPRRENALFEAKNADSSAGRVDRSRGYESTARQLLEVGARGVRDNPPKGLPGGAPGVKRLSGVEGPPGGNPEVKRYSLNSYF